jgi:hypothetical protein
MFRCLLGVREVVVRDLNLDEIGDEGGGDCDRKRYGDGEGLCLRVRLEGRSED